MKNWYRALPYFPPAITFGAAVQYFLGEGLVTGMLALYAMQLAWDFRYGERDSPSPLQGEHPLDGKPVSPGDAARSDEVIPLATLAK